jgi:hypothetical protein
VELWRAQPGDVIVLPCFPGQVTMTDASLGGQADMTRIDWERDDGTSGRLELGDFTDVRLVATGDGKDSPWLDGSA